MKIVKVDEEVQEACTWVDSGVCDVSQLQYPHNWGYKGNLRESAEVYSSQRQRKELGIKNLYGFQDSEP